MRTWPGGGEVNVIGCFFMGSVFFMFFFWKLGITIHLGLEKKKGSHGVVGAREPVTV